MTMTFRRTFDAEGNPETTVDRWEQEIEICEELLDRASMVICRMPDNPDCFWIRIRAGAALYRIEGPGSLPQSYRATLVCIYHEPQIPGSPIDLAN